MKYNFDEIIEREQTNTYKHHLRKEVFGTNNVLPLWVADMDFKAAPEITRAISDRVNHGVFGYTLKTDGMYEFFQDWYKRRQNWVIERESTLFYHGVVPSVNLAIQAFSEPGDSIIVQPPVYFPLFQSVENNGREVIYNQLVKKENSYEIDFEALEKSITSRTKLFLFCHPHNPVGRVWELSELQRLSDICEKHGIIMVSDEIHSDIILNGAKHIPWANVSDYARNNSIITVAPSKTFNIAGLSMSAMVIHNKKLRLVIEQTIKKLQLHMISLLSLTAFESAYQYGEPWLEELLVYLQGNYNRINEFCESEVENIRMFHSEATFLAWLDFSQTGLPHGDIKRKLIEDAKVGLSDGMSFGSGGELFQRLNFAAPRSVVNHALENIKKVFG